MVDVIANLLSALIDLLAAAWSVLISVLALVTTPPILPLIAWIAFWLFAVDWIRLRSLLLKGGCVALILIGLMTVLIWGEIAPPPLGYHNIFGLHVSNFVGKFVYVSSLFCIMLLCGSVQLTGCCDGVCCFRRVPDDNGSCSDAPDTAVL